MRARWVWPSLLAASLAVYFPALRGGLIWDDDAHVTRLDLQSLSGLRRIWCEFGATQQYYPVLHSAFWLEHRIWGDAALGYHLLNIGLHATAAWLFFLTLRRVWGVESETVRFSSKDQAALLAAFIFAAHPICVESVAWISEQKNTLSTVFYLLAAWIYLGQARHRFWLATACFILALLTKSVTATLPAALLVVLWWRQGGLSWRRDVVPLLPWLALGLAMGLLTAWVERKFIGAQGAPYDLSFTERCVLAGRAVGFYLSKLVWPTQLMFIYPRWVVRGSATEGWIYPAAVAVVTWVLWLGARGGRTARPARGLLAGWLFFIGSLFPALGFFNVYPFLFSYVADHFQYLAALGVIAVAAAGWGRWAGACPARVAGRSLPIAVGLVVVLGLGAASCRQSRTYVDVQTLYRTTLARNPGAWLAHLNLGSMLVDRGDVAAGIAHYEAALRLNPDYADAHFDLGKTLLQIGRPAEAVPQFAAAIRLNPADAESHNNLGVALASTGRLPEAAVEFRAALRLRPDYPHAHNNLGLLLSGQGEWREAEAHFITALRLKPDYPEARRNLDRLRAEHP